MTSKEKRKNLLGYEHFKLQSPKEIDYSAFKQDFCHYCGSRYSDKFYDSVMGSNSLCSVHYKILRKDKLHIPEKVESVPLYPDKNTELLYLNNKMNSNK